MRLTLTYDLGDGPVTVKVGPRAMVAWELATKQKFSDIGQGIGINDLLTMLYEQMKADGSLDGMTRAQLLDRLVDINPRPDESPTSPDEEPSSALSAS